MQGKSTPVAKPGSLTLLGAARRNVMERGGCCTPQHLLEYAFTATTTEDGGTPDEVVSLVIIAEKEPTPGFLQAAL